MILYFISYFSVFILFSYGLLLINNTIYKNPFERIYQNILGVLVKIDPNINNNDYFQALQITDRLKWALESIIDYCNITIANTGKQSEAELHNKILHVILTEHHYTSSNKMLGENIDNLYLEQLRRLVNEDTRTMEVSEFFREVVAYCCEYYNELDLKISISKRSNKVFMFKHAALIEVIFHIFGLIARIGKFDIENREVILKATFAYKKQFPTISIETNLLESSLKSLGWEAGPSYVYSGLLSIYLLAKENNLFFHIKQKNQKVIFVLDSIESEQHISNHLLNIYNTDFHN